MNDLLPCPFCGGAARWSASTEDDENEISCSNPDCMVVCFVGGSDAEVDRIKAAWNRRATRVN